MPIVAEEVIVGKGFEVPRSLVHKSNWIWQLTGHEFWAISFLEIGARLPAKLVAIEQKRIITAGASFI